ncbi:sodium:calcium antiporter [Desulfolucanica intricata]|uniref:sodium:calcium antiporter n=1 Tax=Desulfolucanica intricata TaxID=1285191 RepID=UPI000830DDEA|nr:sodium:calcium antiporter [Desulfolucanica intricata]
MLYDIALLIISLGVILAAAGFFTNGVEWLGKKLGLTEGAVGSILAAVGTAMPETIIPIIAVLFGAGEASHDIGIGAILGAPFMLSTIAFFLVGIAAYAYRRRRKEYPLLNMDAVVIRRDLGFFLVVYTMAIGASFLPREGKLVVAVFLVSSYIYFVYKTLTSGEEFGDDEQLDPLFFARHRENPGISVIVLQVSIAFLGIVIGAKFFVDGINDLSMLLGVPAFIFSLLVAPVATELPEKINSVIWIGQSKDTIAMGNLTGAMVFQSSIIPAVGILLTPWMLTPAALLSSILALTSALAAYVYVRRNGCLDSRLLVGVGGLFYLIFVGAVVSGQIK